MDTNSELPASQGLGLFQKYVIQHAGGRPIDPNALYFVLRYDADTEWGRISRETLWRMCKRIEDQFPALAADLREKITQIGLWRVFSNDYETFVAMDMDDLEDAYKEYCNEPIEEMDDWAEIPPSEIVCIICEDDDFDSTDSSFMPPSARVEREEEHGYVRIYATARDWAKANGRGLLCSTES